MNQLRKFVFLLSWNNNHILFRFFPLSTEFSLSLSLYSLFLPSQFSEWHRRRWKGPNGIRENSPQHIQNNWNILFKFLHGIWHASQSFELWSCVERVLCLHLGLNYHHHSDEHIATHTNSQCNILLNSMNTFMSIFLSTIPPTLSHFTDLA